MSLLEQKCLMPSGRIADKYYLVEKKDVVMILALTKKKQVILVNEYKHGAGEVLLQLPIGFMEKGEKPARAALRELAEETGFTAKKAAQIGKFISSPSDMTNKIYLFFVKDAQKTQEQHLDETEEINVVLMPFLKVADAVLRGRIKVMPHMAAILLAKEKGLV